MSNREAVQSTAPYVPSGINSDARMEFLVGTGGILADARHGFVDPLRCT
jgi:hypothetical protein